MITSRPLLDGGTLRYGIDRFERAVTLTLSEAVYGTYAVDALPQ